MPNRDDLLEELTFKGQFADQVTARRVYHTLCGDKNSDGPKPASSTMTPQVAHLRLHRISKALAGIVELLEAKGVLTESEIDELLLDAAQ